MNKLKILTWNIRRGGKKEINNIIASLILHNADIIVLTEFRENETGELLISELVKEGWSYYKSSNPQPNENGIIVLSKIEIENTIHDYQLPEATQRWNEIYIPQYDMYLLGVHIPNVNETLSKRNHWESIINYCKMNNNTKCIILGDFNSALREDCGGSPVRLSQYLDDLKDLGWEDGWRKFNTDVRDYTWYSNANNGFRIDYAFLSPEISNQLLVSYHSHRERILNYSDHSMLIINLKEKMDQLFRDRIIENKIFSKN